MKTEDAIALLTLDEKIIEVEPAIDPEVLARGRAFFAAFLQVGIDAAKNEVQPILVGRKEAAKLLGITLAGLDHRVALDRVPGIVRTGRRVQFRLDVLKEMRGSRSVSRSTRMTTETMAL